MAGRPNKTRRMADLARQKARERAGKKMPAKKLSPAVQMAQAYEMVLGEYLHHPTLSYFKGADLDPKMRTTAQFTEAAKMADEVGADYEKWVRAQFYWIHEWYGRFCKVYELRGKKGRRPAKDRYKEWLSIVEKQEGVTGKVASIVQKAPKIETSKVDKINETRLRRLMQAYDQTEEEILLAFSDEGIFDHDWLKTNSTYTRLLEAGKI